MPRTPVRRGRDVSLNSTAALGCDVRWRLGHRPALDGVRGLAFAGVLAGHAGWPLPHNRAHELGVELFFVLSGFLITALLLEEHERNGRIDLRSFYWRRSCRLLPALVVVAGAALLVASRTSLLDWGGTRRGVIGGLTYSSNVVKINGWDLGPLGHLWSLAVEEHFYVVWPALLIAALAAERRWGWRSVAVVVPTVLMLASFAWRCWVVANADGDVNARLYYPSDSRAMGPLAGCVLALLLVRRGDARANRWALRLGILGLLALTWLATGPGITDRPATFVAGLPLATLAAVAVCVAGSTTDNAVSRLLSTPTLQWLGRISYAGYLVHYPIYFAGGYELTDMSTGQAVEVIGFSLLAGAAVERLVERPLRARRHRKEPIVAQHQRQLQMAIAAGD